MPDPALTPDEIASIREAATTLGGQVDALVGAAGLMVAVYGPEEGTARVSAYLDSRYGAYPRVLAGLLAAALVPRARDITTGG